MGKYNQSTRVAVADMNQGLLVTKANSSCGATTDVPLFTIGGGAVCLLGLVGVADGVMQAAATTILIKNVVGGTDTDLSIASGSLSGLAADTMLTLPAAVGGALTISTNEGAAALGLQPRYFLQPGSLTMPVGAATNTQTLTWHLWYVPMEDGAYVEAA